MDVGMFATVVAPKNHSNRKHAQQDEGTTTSEETHVDLIARHHRYKDLVDSSQAEKSRSWARGPTYSRRSKPPLRKPTSNVKGEWKCQIDPVDEKDLLFDNCGFCWKMITDGEKTISSAS